MAAHAGAGACPARSQRGHTPSPGALLRWRAARAAGGPPPRTRAPLVPPPRRRLCVLCEAAGDAAVPTAGASAGEGGAAPAGAHASGPSPPPPPRRMYDVVSGRLYSTDARLPRAGMRALAVPHARRARGGAVARGTRASLAAADAAGFEGVCFELRAPGGQGDTAYVFEPTSGTLYAIGPASGGRGGAAPAAPVPPAEAATLARGLEFGAGGGGLCVVDAETGDCEGLSLGALTTDLAGSLEAWRAAARARRGWWRAALARLGC